MSEAMNYGLCLDSGEFIAADELNSLYTHPAQQAKPQPLSDEQIERCRQAGYSHEGLRAEFSFENAARAIEAAACAERDARIAELERQLAEVRKQMDAQKDEWLSWDAKRSALEKDAERFVAFASGKANIMQSMIATICKQQPTDLEWWRTAIDAAMKKE